MLLTRTWSWIKYVSTRCLQLMWRKWKLSYFTVDIIFCLSQKWHCKSSLTSKISRRVLWRSLSRWVSRCSLELSVQFLEVGTWLLLEVSTQKFCRWYILLLKFVEVSISVVYSRWNILRWSILRWSILLAYSTGIFYWHILLAYSPS